MTRASAPPGPSALRVARRIRVRGVVQGVGFRPFIWRLATAHGIAGWVRNDGGLVTIHAEGAPAVVEAFTRAITIEAPPLSRIDDVAATDTTTLGMSGFDVAVSADLGAGARLVSPDAAACPACLRELFDPEDRRYRYPFINCTDCGPRFTIIEALPYDRERTSMRSFPMCEDCWREYEDPGDRRFHAEPVACPACGPSLRADGFEGDDVIGGAAELLLEGAIVALKGLGGFHLACDATDEAAVSRLRERKDRPDKPFAVMVPTPDDLHAWFEPTSAESDVLRSWRAPIVLVADRGRLAPSVAPGHRRQGAMLPSTPLHHLLLREAARPLVMTSGNASDEPICTGNDEAIERLGRIADAFVLHDRDIVTRYDDSVVRVRTDADVPTVWRRARSFAPHPLQLDREIVPATLGTGALLHGAFCVAGGRKAFLSQHVGDLDTEESMAAYRAAFERARALFGIEPERVAHDLHPDFMTTRFAEELELPRTAVQHHHAHVAATMAEHGLVGEVLGIAFDGLGLGDDGTIWGGEFLVCDPRDYHREGHLRPVRQPGGDAATRVPWRMALAHAAEAGVLDDAVAILAPPEAERDVVVGQLASGLASPPTSSIGRLFDAVAALTGVCRERATYEGQPAMLLEQAADPGADGTYPFDITDGSVLDPRPAIAALVRDVLRGVTPPVVAARFHAGLAAASAAAATRIAQAHGIRRVVLGGGVFHNDVLTTDLVARLMAAGLQVFLPEQVPVGDGGIALGQVWVAAARGA